MSAITFNPHAQILLRRRGGELVAVSAAAPVRGRPLRIVTFSREDDPEIVALLGQIAGGGGAVEAELDDRIWARLLEAGLLLPAEEVPAVPKFRCDPRDPPRDLVPLRARGDAPPRGARLRVNPTLRYQDEAGPPDEGLAPKPRFGAGQQEAGQRLGGPGRAAVNPFAADRAWAWVDHPDAAAPGALSIADPDRGALRRLRPGEAPPEDLDPDLVGALRGVDVLVDPDDIARRRAAWAGARAEAAERLARDRYAAVRGLLHPAQVAALRRYYRQLIAEGHVRFDDRQVPLRFSAHNEPLSRFFHRRLAGLVGELAGERVVPSYAFFAAYTPGAVLEPHRDREQCAISISLLLDHVPEPDDLSPWPLWLGLDRGAPGGRAAAVCLGLGDGLFYRGTELIHWREALPEGHASTSLLLHYVPADFAGPLD
jgi:hypothetical protein